LEHSSRGGLAGKQFGDRRSPHLYYRAEYLIKEAQGTSARPPKAGVRILGWKGTSSNRNNCSRGLGNVSILNRYEVWRGRIVSTYALAAEKG
jgi:hypothetical protein